MCNIKLADVIWYTCRLNQVVSYSRVISMTTIAPVFTLLVAPFPHFLLMLQFFHKMINIPRFDFLFFFRPLVLLLQRPYIIKILLDIILRILYGKKRYIQLQLPFSHNLLPWLPLEVVRKMEHTCRNGTDRLLKTGIPLTFFSSNLQKYRKLFYTFRDFNLFFSLIIQVKVCIM